MELGKKIAYYRKNLNITQDALAKQLGISNQAVSKWETDQSCPEVELLPKLADIFGISLDELFERDWSAASRDCEQAAENTERDADDLLKCAYMSNFVGEEFLGVVSGVTNFGIFAELENGVEGIIRLENLTDDYYDFDV